MVPKEKGLKKNNSTDISKAAGFDSGKLVTSGQNDNDSTNESTQTGKSEGNSNEELKHTGRVHGNIGVTTSQQMIEEERRVADWNMYEYLIEKFKQQFLILLNSCLDLFSAPRSSRGPFIPKLQGQFA